MDARPMIPVLSAAEMREADRRAIEELGLPGAVLMENAGTGVAALVRERWPGARRVAVLCGKGNNGGDGFVAARRLLDRVPQVFLLGAKADVRGEARLHLEVLERSGGLVAELADAQAWAAVRDQVLGAQIVIDALLGTGIRDRPSGLVAQVIQDLGSADRSATVVAVDIPSGLSSDTGHVDWETVRADVTVAFAAPKHGHVLPPACERVGELVTLDIGIPPATLHALSPQLWLLEPGDVARVYGRRSASAHKGTFGHVLVVAGSVGKTGAAVLSGSAALRAGAGLVTVATPAPALALVAQGRAELMTEPLPVGATRLLAAEATQRALELARHRNAVVLGPGLGQGDDVRRFVREFVAACQRPLVLDADGLNAVVAASPGAPALDVLRREAATVVTPHPGEMARLLGSSVAEVQERRLESARSLAADTGAVVVLKGQRTIVAEPGGRAAVNPTGNPGMATGGTGDVLAGILGALLARGTDAWTAAIAAVYLHGSAGDRAAQQIGQEGMLAGDVLDALPGVLHELEAGHP